VWFSVVELMVLFSTGLVMVRCMVLLHSIQHATGRRSERIAINTSFSWTNAPEDPIVLDEPTEEKTTTQKNLKRKTMGRDVESSREGVINTTKVQSSKRVKKASKKIRCDDSDDFVKQPPRSSTIVSAIDEILRTNNRQNENAK